MLGLGLGLLGLGLLGLGLLGLWLLGLGARARANSSITTGILMLWTGLRTMEQRFLQF